MLTYSDKEFCVSIGRHVRQSLLAWWAEGCGATSKPQAHRWLTRLELVMLRALAFIEMSGEKEFT